MKHAFYFLADSLAFFARGLKFLADEMRWQGNRLSLAARDRRIK